METYPKIQTVFKRDPENKFRTLLIGDYSLPEFEYLKNNKWVFTEKVDGTNVRVIYNNGALTFAGKTDNAQLHPGLLKKLQDIFDEAKFRKLFDHDISLYGEGYGAKIQKGGGNYSSEQQFVLFDVKIDGIWLERHNVADIAYKLGIDIVPIIGSGNLDEMVDMSINGFKSIWGDFDAEGIVARPEVEMLTRRNDRIITKIKHKDFI